MPSRLSRSSKPVPPSASTRRIATVVNSVPDATSASSSTARLVAPPVPMMSRDAKLRSAIVSLDSAGLTTLHRRYYLEPQRPGRSRKLRKSCCPVGSRQHRGVQRHGYPTFRKTHRLKEGGHGGLVVDLDLPLVYQHDHEWAFAIATGTSSD